MVRNEMNNTKLGDMDLIKYREMKTIKINK